MKANSSFFGKTVTIIGFSFRGIKPGQWIKLEGCGSRGQYMGTTSQGTEVVRWQVENAKFQTQDAHANRPIRQYAKRYGAK